MRIVSLVPSVTETLSAWGCPPIACTRFCERPDLVLVGGTKDPQIDRIIELEPDLVVMDEDENRREDYELLVSRDIEVHALAVRSLLDVNPSISALADRVGASWLPTLLPEPIPEHARAFIPIWRRPWIALGTPTYGASLLAHLGISTVFVAEGPYPKVKLDDAVAHHPDLVIAPSEPYPFTTRQRAELEGVAPTIFVDGRDLFWWGSRTPGAIARLAEVLTAL